MEKDGYIEFVAQKAMEMRKIFFLDTGEGNDFFDQDRQWYIEDLSGWLINPCDREKFLKCKKSNTIDDEFSDCYVFVRWRNNQNRELEVCFQYY